MMSYLVRPITLWKLLFLMGCVSPRAYADQALKQQLLTAMNLGSCPKVVIQTAQGRCTEGDGFCIDATPEGKKVLEKIKQGCADGRGGEGAPCLYGILIRPDGKAQAVCGPRMQEAKR